MFSKKKKEKEGLIKSEFELKASLNGMNNTKQ